MSDFIELCGFGALVEGVNLMLGRGPAFIACGLTLLFVGSAIDDQKIAANLRKSAALPLAGYRRIRRRLKSRSQRRAEGQRLPAVRA